MAFTFALVGAVVLAVPLYAKDSLGMYAEWAAFRDPGANPRCYAIAKPERVSASAAYAPFASVANWPNRSIRGQFHLRLSRELAEGARIRLRVGTRNFTLIGGGGDAWAQDTAMDAGIVAAIRSATRMSVTARSASGARFTDRYSLSGAATAIDAATVGCAQL